MNNSFILAKVNERTFWSKAYEGDPGVAWLLDKHPSVHQWLDENAIEYRILFEYISPFTDVQTLQVRVELPDDNDAVHFKLKWC
jgi:hypothetical protein